MGPMVILVCVLTAVLTAAAGVAWGQFLEHRRRVAAMEVVKAALTAGREPPQQILDELTRAGQRKAPWTEVVVFTALAFGFWIAFFRAGGGDEQTAFLVVAATMSVTAFGCLMLALMAPGGGKVDDGA